MSFNPTITGTQAGQKTTDQATIKPFSGVTLGDTFGENLTVIVIVSGEGGTLSGSGIVGFNATQYQLGPISPATVTSQLDNLVFKPAAGAAGSVTTTTFTLQVVESLFLYSTDDSTTTVIDANYVAPTITGAGGPFNTTNGAADNPFNAVTVGDVNSGATDTLTITLAGSGGQLSGTGVSGSGSTYTITGSASAITSDLHGLSFTPAAGLPDTSGTTTFTLSDKSSEFGTAATAASIIVVNTDPAVAPTISGAAAGQATAADAALKPFTAVTIGDTNSGGTDTLTITIGGAGGVLSGSGITKVNASTYTITGSAADITAALDAALFTPNPGVSGTVSTTTFTLSDQSSAYATATTNSTTTVLDYNTLPPTIAGTVAGQATSSEAAVTPFAGVTIGDTNNAATDTLTITVGGTGGTLSGTGIVHTGGGTYTITGTAGAVTAALDAARFVATAGQANTTSTATFTLSDQSSVYPAPVTDSITTVVDTDPAVAPTITGTVAGQTTTSEANIQPFTMITITDANANATDTLTITVSGGNGLSMGGTGITSAPGGIFTVIGTAAQITADLHTATVFNLQSGGPNSHTTTSFTLSDQSSAFATPARDTTTSIVDIDPAVAPAIAVGTASHTTTSEAAVSPFSTVTITDANAGGTDTLTIAVGGTGGTLSGTGVTGGTGGVYTITGTAAVVTADLQGASFKPNGGTPHVADTSTFRLTDVSTAYATAAVNSAVTVVDTPTFYNVSGAVSGLILSGGNNGTVQNGGTSTSATVSSGSVLTVSSGGTAIGTAVRGGAVAVSGGTTSASVVSSGGIEVVTSGGVTSSATVSSGGALSIGAGGTAAGSVVRGGTETVASGGVTSSATISSGGTLSIGAGGTAAGSVVAGGTETVGSGGVTSSAMVSSGGTLSLGAGGTAAGSVVAGGTETVGSGGATSSATVSSGGTLSIGAGGSASGTVVSGGSVTVAGTDSGSVVAGGTVTIASGGVTSNATINGGTEVLAAGATASGVTLSSGGTLVVSSGSSVTNLNLAGGTLALPSIPYSSNPQVTFSSGLHLLTISGGGSFFSFQIVGDYSFQHFTVAQSPSGNATVTASPNVAPTISGTVAGQTTVSEAPVHPFAGVTIADANTGATDTLTITTSGGGGGVLSGTGITRLGKTTFVITGTAVSITSALDAATFTPSAAGTGASSTTVFTLSDQSSAFATAATDSATTVIDTDPGVAPAISGSVVGLGLAAGGSAQPFGYLAVTDANVGATDTVTITIGGVGGSVSGTGVTGSNGVYTITGTAATVTQDLQAATFTAGFGTIGQAGESTVTLSDKSSGYATAVSTSGSLPVFSYVPPTITGTVAGQTTAAEAPVTPFKTVTIGDVNDMATESLTITLGGAAGGSLSGTGITASGANTYSISGSPAAVTSALDAAVFTPAPGAPNAAQTTTFTLTDLTVFGMEAVDSTTTVTDTAAAVAPVLNTSGYQQASVLANAAITPFGSVSVTDANVGATDTLTLVFGSASGASASLSGTNIVHSSSNTYTIVGTAAAITTALQAATFTSPGTAGLSTSVLATPYLQSSAYGTQVTGNTLVVTVNGYVAPSITGTIGGQSTSAEAPVHPFAGVTIGDINNPATDTLTIVVSGPGYGTLSAANVSRSGKFGYTLTGTAAAITTALQAATFTPSAGSPNSSLATTLTLMDQSSAYSQTVTDATTTVIDHDPSVAPTISGTTAGHTTYAERAVSPFGGVTVGDLNSGGTDTLTITFSNGPGTRSGTLSGTGVVHGSGASYSITGTAAVVTAELDAAVFTPTLLAGVPSGDVGTIAVQLSDTSSANATVATDSTVTVIDTSETHPVIRGVTSSRSTTSDAALTPFAGVTIVDADPTGIDTVTVTVGGYGGTLSGTGVTAVSSGTYTITGSAAAVTADLDAAVFTPTPGMPATMTTTTLSLSDNNVLYPEDIASSAVTVVNTDPAITPTVTGVTASPATADAGIGQTVTLTLAFSIPVAVAGGTPTLSLNDGGTATYVSGSGTGSLVFSYTVAPGDSTAALAVTGVNLHNATITGVVGGLAAVLTGAAVQPAGTLQVDTAIPTVTSNTASVINGHLGVGQSVSYSVVFSKPVTVTGTPALTLNDGGTATYASGSGSNTLVFTTVFAAGQEANSLAVTGSTLNGGAIKDAAGNAANLSGAVVTPSGTVWVDTPLTITTANPAGVTLVATNTTLTSTATAINPAATGAGIYGGVKTAWTVTNSGTVSGYDGVGLAAGGAVTNTASGKISGTDTGVLLTLGHGVVASEAVSNAGTISGATYGVRSQGAPLSLVNTGSISSANTGVQLDSGGTLTNAAGGIITGQYAVYASAAATILNAGTITASTGAGVYLLAGGSITNQASGTISGSASGVYAHIAGTVVNTGSIHGTVWGAYLGTGSTLVNAGTIGGNGDYSKDAVHVGDNSTVVVDPGAVFNGNVYSTGKGTDVLELASASSAGTIGSVGTGQAFDGFTQVNLDAGASWTLTGSTAPVFLGGGGDTLTTGTGTVTIIAGASTTGADTIRLGTGLATLDISKNLGASITISGLSGSDQVNLTGFGPNAKVTALGPTQYEVGSGSSQEVFTVVNSTSNWAQHYTLS